MDLYFIRHSESTGNGQGRFLGWSDHPLTARGRAQAEAAGARLAALGPMPVLCSDLPRADETARIVAARWGVPVEPDARWREIGSGSLEGLPWDALAADAALAAAYEADPFHTAAPGGESAAVMAERAVAAFTGALARPEPRLVVVTHDGPLRAVFAHVLGIPSTHFWRLTTRHGGLTHIAMTDGWLTVVTMNEVGHLAAVDHPGMTQQPAR